MSCRGDGTAVSLPNELLFQIPGFAADTECKPGIKAIVVDCGNITNAGSGLAGVIERASIKAGLSSEDAKTNAKLGKAAWNCTKIDPAITSEQFWAALMKETKLSPDLVPELDAEVKENLRVIFPETIEVLRAAKAKGYVIGMISNHLHFWIETCVESAGLRDIIPECLLVDSQAACCAKPEPLIYQAFLAILAVKHPGFMAANCLFLDDKQPNIDTAEAVGFQVLCHDSSIAEPGALRSQLTAMGIVL